MRPECGTGDLRMLSCLHAHPQTLARVAWHGKTRQHLHLCSRTWPCRSGVRSEAGRPVSQQGDPCWLLASFSPALRVNPLGSLPEHANAVNAVVVAVCPAAYQLRTKKKDRFCRGYAERLAASAFSLFRSSFRLTLFFLLTPAPI